VRDFVLAFIFCLALPAHAADETAEPTFAPSEYRVDVDVRERRLMLGLYGQITQFSGTNGSLQGYTIEAVADYAIRPSWAAQVSLGQAISSQGGLSVMFTDLRAGFGYAVSGSFMRQSSLLNVNNREVLATAQPVQPAFIVDVGVDQVMFNGTSRLVPGTGGSLGLRYDFKMWDMRLSAMGRYGQLLISGEMATVMTVGLGALFDF